MYAISLFREASETLNLVARVLQCVILKAYTYILNIRPFWRWYVGQLSSIWTIYMLAFLGENHL